MINCLQNIKKGVIINPVRRGVRVVERGSLENCCAVKSTGGSNPPLSAIFLPCDKAANPRNTAALPWRRDSSLAEDR